MTFKEFLLLNERSSSGTKLGLYPDLADVVGQYPPLYSSASKADYNYYYFTYFKGGDPPGKNGIHWFQKFKGIDAPGLPR